VLAAIVLTALAPVYPARGRAAKQFADRLAPPRPAASASPAPGVGTTPAQGPDALPSAMVGTWTGTVNQSDPAADYQASYVVTLVLRGGVTGNVVGTSDYPTVPCTGDLLLNRGGSDVQVTEHIVSGTQCSDTMLSLSLDAGGNLRYHFDDSGDGTGDGVLTRG
jgi:hypothetical protein